MDKKDKIVVGISLGDVNGVGIEVVLKTFEDQRMLEFCTPVLFGSSKIISTHKKILNIEKIKNAVIFCNKKIDINKVNIFLKKNKFSTVCLHGDMNQSARINSLEEFKSGLAKILVASDVAARGLDIAGLSHVFNYDVPNNPEDYIHRIGRTGRAGLSGKAFTLCSEKEIKSLTCLLYTSPSPRDS